MSCKKLCSLVKKGMVKEEKNRYCEMVQEARFLCKKCGRVAKKDKHLCKPVAM